MHENHFNGHDGKKNRYHDIVNIDNTENHEEKRKNSNKWNDYSQNKHIFSVDINFF